MCDVKELKDLIVQHIHPEDVYVGYIAKRLTALSDNYGSLMLAVDVKIKNKNSEIKTIHLIAKKIQKFFTVDVSFRKELAMYENVIPLLIDFQNEQGKRDMIKLFPKYYGGRLNAKGDASVVDEDGVILLENLKIAGYRTLQGTTGLNLEPAKFLLRELAIFHAVPIALKLKEPERFKDRILPFLSKFDVFINMKERIEKEYYDKIFEIIESDKACAGCIDRVKNTFNSYSSDVIYEPFATISHNDYQIGNTMLKVLSGKLISCKLLDFQMMDYGSPGKDIIFFIFNSVKSCLLEEHYDELIKTYFSEFIWTLQDLNCDISAFTFEAFEKELELSAKNTQLLRLLFMCQPVLADMRHVKELKSTSHIPVLGKLQKEKVLFVVQQFLKRNWI